ncbi:hypothetical protein Hanom_Chr00s210399g01840461 [Helianthus anomalus]
MPSFFFSTIHTHTSSEYRQPSTLLFSLKIHSKTHKIISISNPRFPSFWPTPPLPPFYIYAIPTTGGHRPTTTTAVCGGVVTKQRGGEVERIKKRRER